jgi:hypothetical protein
MKRLRGEPLEDDELAFLAVWFRGGGKSSNVEWACIAEGAILGDGYVLYACETEGQALDHVAAIRDRLESSEIAHYYPGLASPEVGLHGNQIGWSKDYLATASSWGIIPVGLDTGLRGGRKRDLRFTMIVLDDVDNEKDSPAVVEKKLRIISRSILPAGQADTIVLFAQNLIHEDSVLNQILTRRSDVLSERVVSGPVKAFEDLELEMDDVGRVWTIESGVPTWPDIDMAKARRFLAKSGKSAFMAEYQHDFSSDQTERVLNNWDDDVHAITKSQFAAVFGTHQIPRRWYKYVGNDWSRTKSAYHANVAAFVAVSGQSERLPGFVFMYDAMSFDAGTEADDVGLAMLKAIAPTVDIGPSRQNWDDLVTASLLRSGLEQYIQSPTKLLQKRREVLALIIPPYVDRILSTNNYIHFRGSHEQNKNALAIYRDVYGLPFSPCNPGEDGGLEWINHHQKVDYERPHPFKADVMGYSRFFLIVDDDKAAYPASLTPDKLHGSDLARYQFKHWRNRPVKLSEAGAIERGPMKMNDDFGNLLMFLFHDNSVQAAPMTEQERHECQLDARLQMENIEPLRGTMAYMSLISARQHELARIAAREEEESAEEALKIARLLGRRPALHSKYRRRR